MVISSKIKCEICDSSFYIKYQMDQLIYQYPWNLDFYCPDCGDRIHVTFCKNGLNCKSEKGDNGGKAYMLGYSSCLPITKEMYLPLTEEADRRLFFSPFFNLSRKYSNQNYDVIQKHGNFISAISANILPYRSSLLQLLPLLNKQNMKPEAYTKKMAKAFNIDSYRKGLSTYTDCVAHYAELVECCYTNLKPNTPASSPYGILFNDLMVFASDMDKNELRILKDELNQYYSLKEWLVKNAFSYIAKIISKIEKYFPAMFYGVTEEHTCPHSNQLYLVTINDEEVNADYSSGYEVIEKIFPIVVALENKLSRGDINAFEDDRYSMDQFMKLTVGMRVKALQQNDVLKTYFLNSLNNKIRNGETHDNSHYDSEHQICRYIDFNNPNNMVEIPLMDVAFMTYIQFIRIMEIALVVNKILQRIWN